MALGGLLEMSFMLNPEQEKEQNKGLTERRILQVKGTAPADIPKSERWSVYMTSSWVTASMWHYVVSDDGVRLEILAELSLQSVNIDHEEGLGFYLSFIWMVVKGFRQGDDMLMFMFF